MVGPQWLARRPRRILRAVRRRRRFPRRHCLQPPGAAAARLCAPAPSPWPRRVLRRGAVPLLVMAVRLLLRAAAVLLRPGLCRARDAATGLCREVRRHTDAANPG